MRRDSQVKTGIQETRRRDTLFRITSFSIVSILLVTLTFVPVFAARGGKAGISSDLVEAMKKGSPSRTVRLVVSLDGADPAAVASQVTALGGEVRKYFRHVNHMLVIIPLESVGGLAEIDGIDYIAPDRDVSGVASQLETTTGASLAYTASQGGVPVPGLDGTGVTVAIIDSGIDANHSDLRNNASGRSRVLLSMDFTGTWNLDDPYGHGTHIAGIIAGDGSSSYTVQRDYTGMAPKANLLNLKVLDGRGHGYVSNVLAAIDYAIATRSYYNTKVINMSLAAPPIDSYVNDALCKAVAKATKAGIVVVVSAGNFGQDQNGNKVYGSITSPGISPSAITVGASNGHGTDVRSDDTIAPFSSRGPTRSHTTDPLTGAVVYDNLVKPDLVAPGCRVVSLERYNNYLVTTYPVLHVDTGNNINKVSRYMILSGTSMSTGVVSGAVTLMMQANPGLTPNLVKAILMYTAQIMNGPDLFEQGAGMLNVDGAVRMAKSLSPYSYALPAGTPLAVTGLPAPQSTIAGETVAWSQSLIWGGGMLRGDSIFTAEQAAYAQSLIWGIGRYDAWGDGVTYYDGLYADGYVVFGNNNQWNYVTWTSGTPQPSGLIWSDAMSASGLIWQDRLISSDFFNVGPSSLIWGFSGYGGFDAGLIWGIYDSGLIWGIADGW